jgi:transcriptional regulator with PAS, ATPase and Fis domain
MNSAEKYFLKAIDDLDRSGVRWEKVEALVAAAGSGAFSNRRRLTYLFRAEEFFSRNRITSRQVEVGRLIGSLGSVENRRSTRAIVSGQSDADAEYFTDCPAIARIKGHLRQLAHADLPVLLTGETGVGKDRMAKYFHRLACPAGPYVAINCASVPETLLESELFGYAKGAFTGADRNKPGLFVKANGGMLFLDEIGDLPLSLQSKLLGVLERRKVLPLGSTVEVDLDVKLVTATNRDLEAMVDQGGFRRDLYYRLSGISFSIPPLRERREDIVLLLDRFLEERGFGGKAKRLPPELMRRFIEYDWPGNVRELENKVKRLEVVADMVHEGDLTELTRFLFGEDQPPAADGNLFERVEEFERRLVVEAVLAARGNKCEAARMLGIHEATVRTKLRRYAISLEGGAAEARAS